MMMNPLVTLGLVGAGVWAAFRAHGARDMQVPLDVAFAHPFESLAVLNRKAWDASHPLTPSAGATIIGNAIYRAIPGVVVDSSTFQQKAKPGLVLDFKRS